MSPIRIFCASLLLLALGLPASLAGEQRGSYTENKRWGYKVRAPKKWKSRAIRLDERWIAGKFFPDYSLRARNDMKQFVQAKPDLWVIGFPHDREKERTTVERPDENTVIITVKNPYKDYKDFVQRESWATTGAGGWYFSREEKIQHNDIDVDVYEIKVEKLVVAPMRVVTWVYHLADVDFAVQVRILEAHYEENKSVIAGVMKSFREIPRTEPFPEDDDSSGTRMGGEEGEVLFVEEINAQRTRKVEARIERELKHLPRDWRCKKSKHFVILGPKDKRYTMPMNYVMNFAVEIRKYLEKNFADLGPSEVPRGLIRMFKSNAEEQAYNQGTRGWWADEVGEITMTYSAETSLLGQFSKIADQLTDQYFQLKNENLRNGLPGWIRTGIWGHVSWARPSKRKKMVLAPRSYDVIEIRRMIAAGTQLPLRELMTVSGADVDMAHHAQTRSVTYWLLGRGNKGKVKGALTCYLQSLEAIIGEEDAKFEQAEHQRMLEDFRAQMEATEDTSEKTQEELEREEDERFLKRRENRGSFNFGMASKYEAIRVRAQEAAFGHLTEKDWAALDRKWKKFAGG